jgi:hypothetical protein
MFSAVQRAEDARIIQPPRGGKQMLSNKIRTTIVALVASAGLASAAALPAVSQARPIIKGTKVTCPDIDGQGAGQPGELRTISWNVIQPDGSFKIEKETKICGSDGKWHTVLNRELVTTTTVQVAEPVGAYYAG